MCAAVIADREASAQSRIGPNAIIRLQQALHASVGPERTRVVFERAGQGGHLVRPPSHMVAEADVTALYTSLPVQLDSETACNVAIHAGALTGEYLLGNRIPRPVQWWLRVLPATLAAQILLAAIQRHAWTFVGSGRFAAERLTRNGVTARSDAENAGRRARLMLTIAHCPLCRGSVQSVPACCYYAATFEKLFAVLVHPRAQVHEVACEALGAPACAFEVSW